MSFWIPARELSIVWGNDTRYWKWTRPDACSSDVAELIDVCWMDISGKIDAKRLKVKTSYAAFLVFKLKDQTTHLDKATGSTRFIKEISEGSGREGYTVFIDTRKSNAKKGRFPHKRSDGWMEIKLGEFFNDLGDDGDVEMRLIETDDNKWKSGLIVRGIDLRVN